MTQAPVPFVGSGFLWRLEARLARLLGCDRWPAIEARTYSNHVPADLRSYDAFTSFLAFTWTVKGTPYAKVFRASRVYPRDRMAESHTTILQYNPRHPGRVYYAPQEMLARTVLAAVSILLISGGIAAGVLLSIR